MSNLNRPYEISVWEDILNDEKGFEERRLGVIGSNTMTYQGRALEPQLGRNVNGTKTFQFKMYYRYIDNITGEKIENPFTSWLISERKIKLYYKNKWYDFIIKDIEENSSTYLYTYKLEDAAVIELSKNGFGVTLDEQLNNNLGNPKTLAERVLEDTDWKVESEVIVQKVEDALVRVTIPAGTTAIHLLDQTDLSAGVQETTTTITKDGVNRIEVLAFYSSCTNKPHRFQFIYLEDLADITTDEEGKINNANCQYYIDFEQTEYREEVGTPFFLPTGFNLFRGEDGYLYTDARAERYGFAHQTEYIPKLDKYVYKYHKHVGSDGSSLEEGESIGQDGFVEYTKEDGTTERRIYYGYYDSKYYSPALIQSIVTNSRFDSTSGWTGTRVGGGANETENKATVRNVYGYFNTVTKKFVDSADELLAGTFDPKNENLAPYLEIKLVDEYSSVINSGPYDNRIVIGNMEQGSEWQLDYEIYQDQVGMIDSGISIDIKECFYGSNDWYYYPKTEDEEISISKISYGPSSPLVYKVIQTSYQEKTFKKDSNVRIVITGNPGTYYIKRFEFFQRIINDDGKVIQPDNISQQVDNIKNNVVKNTYRYFSGKALEEATDATDLKAEYITDILSYDTYVPVYNTGAEKVRMVSAKESNYFNILQSIAETFGAWLKIDVKHNNDGSIDKENKYIRFKNYVGKTNYANFRYGVNLKDIQRTYASKEIVTKLTVKPNSNEHANNGFCAIGRANSNPTGEDYIYDFRYFHEKGLLDSNKYLEDVYVPVAKPTSETPEELDELYKKYYASTAGYYYKIKQLNTTISALNDEKIIPIQTDLTQLESEYAVAEAGYDAALQGIEQIREEFEKLTGISIDDITGEISSVTIDTQNSYIKDQYYEEKNGHIYYIPTNGFTITNILKDIETITIDYTINKDFVLEKSVRIELYPILTFENKKQVCKILETKIVPESTGSFAQKVTIGRPIDQNRSDIRNKIIEYTTLRSSEKLYEIQKDDLSKKIEELKTQLTIYETDLDKYKTYKNTLNLTFFKKYSRFIQEGTWIDEKYSDNELYYADALSVMYNSCYPKVAYTINVLALNILPGYESFTFELGDTTYAEDYEFFGDKKEEVVITEFIEFLDEPDKDSIKVQNFKNQFKDLFQKITATVQQAQYNTGSYEKAVALAEANQTRKQQFLSDALNSANARLTTAGQQSVVWDNTGITITDINTPSNQIRMIGGAILLKSQNEKGQEVWTTAITSDGISANLITAGTINAGEIAIMNADEPVFRWDAFGISAFDFVATESEFTTIGPANPKKFVRFDKYGIYGINGLADGMTWHATSQDEIDELSTFALTWEGLKVTNSYGGKLCLGKGAATSDNEKGTILRVWDNQNASTFEITQEGKFKAISGEISGWYFDNQNIRNFENDINESDGGLVLYGHQTKTNFENSPYVMSVGGKGVASRSGQCKKTIVSHSNPQEFTINPNMSTTEKIQGIKSVTIQEYTENYPNIVWTKSPIYQPFSQTVTFNNLIGWLESKILKLDSPLKVGRYHEHSRQAGWSNTTVNDVVKDVFGQAAAVAELYNVWAVLCIERHADYAGPSYPDGVFSEYIKAEILYASFVNPRKDLDTAEFRFYQSANLAFNAGGRNPQDLQYHLDIPYMIIEPDPINTNGVRFKYENDDSFYELNLYVIGTVKRGSWSEDKKEDLEEFVKKFLVVPNITIDAYFSEEENIETSFNYNYKNICQDLRVNTSSKLPISGAFTKIELNDDRQITTYSLDDSSISNIELTHQSSNAQINKKIIRSNWKGNRNSTLKATLNSVHLTEIEFDTIFENSGFYSGSTESSIQISGTATIEHEPSSYQSTLYCPVQQLDLQSTWPFKIEINGMRQINIIEQDPIVPEVSSFSYAVLIGVDIVSTNEYPFVLTKNGNLYVQNLKTDEIRVDVSAKRKRDGYEKYLPLQTIVVNNVEYIIYTTYTYGDFDADDNGVLDDISQLGNLLIVRKDVWDKLNKET